MFSSRGHEQQNSRRIPSLTDCFKATTFRLMPENADKPLLPLPIDSADNDTILERFLGFVETSGLQLYPAQEEAILEIFEGRNVILKTPTGSGKSLVAAAMHYKSLCQGRRSVYTCPIKALVNEKFLALCRDFGPDNVGMSTGDATVNRDAPILCCTAEVLSNMALRDGEHAEVDDVIMDEFHYYSDRDRGVSWQIPLLTLPHARFLLISATLGETSFFEKELSERTGAETTTIFSAERPVPLEFDYREESLDQIIDELHRSQKLPAYLVHFSQRAATETAQKLMSLNMCSKEDKAAISTILQEVRFNSPFGKDLRKFLRNGIGLHHAGLLPKYRRIVEKLCQQNKLKVICGTDTLGVGVNVPIRTVLFTSLAKFDGRKMNVVSIRDFHQISGRAGRKGFDTSGTVIIQAPEHVIENRKREEKASQGNKKSKAVVRKKPPPGSISWDENTFNKLLNSPPESLTSSFQVTHGMLLNVLGRPENGCRAMKDLIRSCHDTESAKSGHRRRAFQLFRSLIEKDIIEIIPAQDRRDTPVRVQLDLQDDFSLNQTLSLFLVDTVENLDFDDPSYPLLVLALAEAILEDPDAILRKQVDALKDELNAQMKAEGKSYEERMERLLEVEHPKPFRDFIYDKFNLFAEKHPWVGQDNIQPKAIGLDMYENWTSFNDYIIKYGLARAEGILLRHLSNLYKVLIQSVPETSRNDDVDEIITFFGNMLRSTDSSLLDEWEQMRDPNYRPGEDSSATQDTGPQDITRHPNLLKKQIRHEILNLVSLLARGDYPAAHQQIDLMAGVDDEDGEENVASILPLKANPIHEEIEQIAEQYYETHGHILLDPEARSALNTRFETDDPQSWRVEQILVDSEGLNDHSLLFHLDLKATRESGRPILHFESWRAFA